VIPEPIFQPANSLPASLPEPLVLPASTQDFLHQLITQLEVGCINMIGGDQLQDIHAHLHEIMVNAIAQDWHITFIDLANCFNPQKIGTLAFEYGMHSQLVLQQIGLARPFQIHQAVSIILNLVRQVEQTATRKNLIVLTDVSSMFFNQAVANEDPDFPIPQLAQMRQCIGILESLAVQGNIVLITERNQQKLSHLVSEPVKEVKAASLQYSAKLHLQLLQNSSEIKLLAHPYLPATTIQMRTAEITHLKKQMSLDQFL